MPKLARYFLISAGILLVLTGLAKVISGLGSAQILKYPDPIFNMKFKYVFLYVGLLELFLGSFCIFSKNLRSQTMLLAYFATCVFIYRIGLHVVGFRKFCSCLGNLTDALHIPPQTANTAMKIVLAYLMTGSYCLLLWSWGQKDKTAVALTSKDFTVPTA